VRVVVCCLLLVEIVLGNAERREKWGKTKRKKGKWWDEDWGDKNLESGIGNRELRGEWGRVFGEKKYKKEFCHLPPLRLPSTIPHWNFWILLIGGFMGFLWYLCPRGWILNKALPSILFSLLFFFLFGFRGFTLLLFSSFVFYEIHFTLFTVIYVIIL